MNPPKYVFITGAAGGIGFELLKIVLRENNKIFCFDIDADSLEKLPQKLGALWNSSICLRAGDCSKQSEIDSAINDFLGSIVGKYQLDLYVVHGLAITKSEIDFDSVRVAKLNMDSNYFGVINTITSALPYLKNASKSQITVVSSNSSLRSTKRSGEYSASKAAINLWLESLRIQLISSATKVTLVLPSFVETKMTRFNTHSMPGIISAEKAAMLIVKATRAGRAVTVIPASAKVASWGLKLLPTPIWVRLFSLLDIFFGSEDQKEGSNAD